MKALAAVLVVLALLGGCGSLRESTHAATAMDATTTAIGVTSGLAVEANPLITSPAGLAGMMIGRVVATEYIHTMPEPDRTEYLSGLSAIWWGAGISNLLILITASNPVALIVGMVAGWQIWSSTEMEREFAWLCAEERRARPGLKCVFNKPA